MIRVKVLRNLVLLRVVCVGSFLDEQFSQTSKVNKRMKKTSEELKYNSPLN